jgi:hypothetical protein
MEAGETVQDSYFNEGPFTFDERPADPWNPQSESLTAIEWAPTLGSMVTAVARSGLRIDALLELPDTDETRADYGIGYGTKGRPGRFILAATRT